MKMKLIRLATVSFTPAPAQAVDWTIVSAEVDLNILDSMVTENECLRVLVGAEIVLNASPEVDTNNSVLIPEDERSKAESVIENFANVVSVGGMCGRYISSPQPWVALIPLDEEASSWFEDKNGISQNTSLDPSFRFSIDKEVLTVLLEDRANGVALLSEGLSQEHPTGQFHEFIRVLELAFKTAGASLVVPLSQFLEGNNQGYTEDEVNNWKDIRDQATHADLQWQPKFALSDKVLPVITRVRQAAFDVLFNKADWHDLSTQRRDLWKPVAFVGPPDAVSVVIQRGSTPTLETQLFDGFGSYPVDLSSSEMAIPDDWWCKQAAKQESE